MPAELYARIRQLEWPLERLFDSEERLKAGNLVAGPGKVHIKVTLEGRRIILTAKEFRLLRFSRWPTAGGSLRATPLPLVLFRGSRYEGGARARSTSTCVGSAQSWVMPFRSKRTGGPVTGDGHPRARELAYRGPHELTLGEQRDRETARFVVSFARVVSVRR